MHLDWIPVLEVTWDPARLSLKVSTLHRLKFNFLKNTRDQLELALIIAATGVDEEGNVQV